MRNHDPNPRGRNGTPPDPEPEDRSLERSADLSMETAHLEMEELIELAGLSDEDREHQAVLDADDSLDGSTEARILERARRELGLSPSAATPAAPLPWVSSAPFRWAVAVAALLVVGFGVRSWMASSQPDYDPLTSLGEGEAFEIVTQSSLDGHPERIEWNGQPADAKYFIVQVYDSANPGGKPFDTSKQLDSSPWIPSGDQRSKWPAEIFVRVLAYGSGSDQLLARTQDRFFLRTS